MRVWLMLAAALLWTSVAEARLTNRDLPAQLKNDSGRVLPSSDNYSLAGDVQFYWNATSGKTDYYHSGYWLNLFGELRPLERLAFNVKLAALNPSNSYGYNAGSMIIPFFSASYYERFFGDQLLVSLLAGDLDRQTLGAGLMVAQKEMSGAILTTEVGEMRMAIVKPGTGVFNYGGDADIVRIDYKDHLIGVYAARFSVLKSDWEYLNFSGVYSRLSFKSGLFYGVELGSRHGDDKALAQVARVGYEASEDIFKAMAWAEHRNYGDGWFKDIAGRVDQDYVTVEDRDKVFVNPMNIAPLAEEAKIESVGVRGSVWEGKPVSLSLRSEVMFWKDRPSSDKPVHVFDQGVLYCPWPGKNTCGRVAYTNVVADTRTPPNQVDFGNHPMQKLTSHLRFEARSTF